MGRPGTARSRGARVVALGVVWLAMVLTTTARAHPLSFGSLRLEREEQLFVGDLVLDVPDAVRALPEAQRRRELVEQVRSGFHIETDEGVVVPQLEVRELGLGGDAVDIVEVRYRVPEGAPRVRFVSKEDVGDVAVELVDATKNLRERSVVAAGTRSRWVDLSPPREPTSEVSPGPSAAPESPPAPRPDARGVAARARSLADYVALGFHHILPQGVDHLLFVASLVSLLEGWGSLFGLLSVFTLGHTLSVGFALFGVASLRAAWVEPLIALSLAYSAVERSRSFGRGNPADGRSRPRWARVRPVVVLGFGVVHGLGFAGALGHARVPVGERVAALFGFNLGVELGQLLVAGALLGLLLALAKRLHLEPYKRVGSYAIGAVGVAWAVLRIVS